MIFTRKHIVIAVLFAVVGIAIGIGIKHYETLQTFSSSDIKVVLDAGRMAEVAMGERTLILRLFRNCRKCLKAKALK